MSLPGDGAPRAAHHIGRTRHHADSARTASNPEKCRATTNKGKPCNNTPQKGEQFCGPHLTQLVAKRSPSRQPTTKPDAYDEPF